MTQDELKEEVARVAMAAQMPVVGESQMLALFAFLVLATKILESMGDADSMMLHDTIMMFLAVAFAAVEAQPERFPVRRPTVQ